MDNDGLGDACDEDDDNDTIADGFDNCPTVSNQTQSNFDNDADGDACDTDDDNDGVLDTADRCASTSLGVVVDPTMGCSIAQICPSSGPMGTTTKWKNHGQYVSCVSKTADSFLLQGLITQAQKDATVSKAGQSNIGK